MKSHLKIIGETDTWITPKYITDALGSFDLDPCAALNMPWQHAKHAYNIENDGLSKDWFGRVWLNPPYNRYQIGLWMEKMSIHKNGVMLVSVATETKRFKDYVYGKATGVLFLDHRPVFCLPDGNKGKGNSGQSICLVVYDQYNLDMLLGSGLGYVFKEVR